MKCWRWGASQPEGACSVPDLDNARSLLPVPSDGLKRYIWHPCPLYRPDNWDNYILSFFYFRQALWILGKWSLFPGEQVEWLMEHVRDPVHCKQRGLMWTAHCCYPKPCCSVGLGFGASLCSTPSLVLRSWSAVGGVWGTIWYIGFNPDIETGHWVLPNSSFLCWQDLVHWQDWLSEGPDSSQVFLESPIWSFQNMLFSDQWGDTQRGQDTALLQRTKFSVCKIDR